MVVRSVRKAKILPLPMFSENFRCLCPREDCHTGRQIAFHSWVP